MKIKCALEFTTETLSTFEEATELANAWSKGMNLDGDETKWLPEYTTTIKIEGIDSDECWAVTNRYDPDIKANMLNEEQ